MLGTLFYLALGSGGVMRTCIITFVSLFILTGVAAPGATAINPSERWQSQLTQLVVAPESSSGYDRDEFGSGWTTQSDGCDTRDHVLRVEAKRGTKRGCEIKEGVWRSKYDGPVGGSVGLWGVPMVRHDT
jgi:hypothetical protein